jgi:hypothetical protein
MFIEKRASARIAVPITARLIVGSQETELSIRDISKGGLFLYATKAPGLLGGAVTLKLGLSSGIRPVLVHGTIARIIPDPSGHGRILGIGIRFAGNDAATERAVVELIERAMLGPGTGNRAFPRVYYLVEVVCRTKAELKAMMRDIGEGGAGLTVDRAMFPNEEVTVEVRGGKPGETLRLKAIVVSCEAVPGHPTDHRVGVRFTHQTAETRKRLKAFISTLVHR